MTDRLRANLVEFADEVELVDLHGRVLAGSRRDRARRVSVASAAAVVVGVLAATAVLVSRPATDSPASAVATALIPGRILIDLESPPEPYPGELANATFTVPPFTDTECPHGEVTMSDGVVEYPGHPFFSAIAVLGAGRADVDEDGRDDVVARITCTHRGVPGATQVVAYARTPSGLRLMGTVVETASPIQGIYDVELIGIPVKVLVADRPWEQRASAVTQWRYYVWDGRRFRQTAGPTAFDPEPPAVDLHVGYSLAEAAGGHLDLTITVENTGPALSGMARLAFRVPKDVRLVFPSGWSGCLLADDSAPTIIEVHCSVPEIWPYERWVATYRVMPPADASRLEVEVEQTRMPGEFPPPNVERDMTDNGVAIELPA
jgi:hypothetical protein